MSMTDRASDIRILLILDRYHVKKLSLAQIGARFGISRNTVAGIVHRNNLEEDNLEPCLCKKPENKDGGMPDRWWLE